MHRWGVRLFALVFIVGLFGTVALALGPNTDVAYVLEDSSSVSLSITNIFDDLELTYDVIRDSEISSTDFSNYRVVLVTEDVDRSAFLPIGTSSMVFFDRDIASMVWSTGSTGLTAHRRIEVDLPGSFIFTDVNIPPTNEIDVYGGAGNLIHYINAILEPGVEVAATKVDTSRAAIAYKVDDTNGIVKEMFFGLRDPDEWTLNSKTMFRNAMLWMFGDVDLDGDGYVFDLDCDDSDPLVHPGAAEIPYDGVDQDCDGSDLDDLDGDGYSSDLVGGLDCDDSNSTINPDNIDLALNCINDAPVIIDIFGDLNVDEGETVLVEILAEDPEGDNLIYGSGDNRFSVNGNTLTWETGYEDSGEYQFGFSVSDAEFSDSDDVLISVQDRNQGPVLTEIPDLTWDEDSNFEINLSDYFFDNDGDAMTFGIEESSGNSNLEIALDGEIAIFTPAENWFGKGEVMFFAFDGLTKTVSNNVALNILDINDPVILANDIPDVTLNEDQILENTLDLYEYFVDVDSELEFSVVGNTNVDIVISGGMVSFTPAQDYSGIEEITFRASDGEFDLESNLVTLSVIEQGEPPVFDTLNCETDLIEDVSENCILSASDFEGDSIEFFVAGNDHLECAIIGEELRYVSEENYFGMASCLLEARDIHGSDFVTLEVNVDSVNDAPEIVSSNPEEDVGIIEGNSQSFAIQVVDPEDDNISSEWILDGNSVFVSSGPNPAFDAGVLDVGSHNLRVIVSDGEFPIEKSWTIAVGPISDFTCNEVGGFIMGEDELCSGEILGVSDGERCCSLAPIPKFEDANSCDLLDNDILIEIREPNPNKEFKLDEKIEVEMELTNNFGEDQNYGVELHLYNLDEDESVVDEGADIEIRSGRTRILKLDLDIPGDLNLDDRYALLVIAEDGACNQIYQELQIERPGDHVIISDFDLPNEAICGEEIEIHVEAENLGSDDQEAKISLINNDLDLEEESREFELEKHDDDDKERMNFDFLIPENIDSEEYLIEAIVSFGDKKDSLKKEMYIECKSESVLQVGHTAHLNEGPVLLNQGREVLNDASQEATEGGISLLLVGMIAMMELLIIGGIGLLFSGKRDK